MDNHVSPEAFLNILFVAANAQTDEEKARVAWRASDYMWRGVLGGENVGLPYARAFNNLLQSREWPWVKGLWSRDEVVGHYKKIGLPDDMIAKMFPVTA